MARRLAPLPGFLLALSLLLPAGCQSPEPPTLFRFERQRRVEPAIVQEEQPSEAGGLDAYTYRVPTRRYLYADTGAAAHAWHRIYNDPYWGYGDIAGFDLFSETYPTNYFLVPSKDPKPPEVDPVPAFELQASPLELPAEGGLVSLRARIGAPAYTLPQAEGLALAVVLDLSESMRDGNKLQLLRRAARYLLAQLMPSDRVALIAVRDAAHLLKAMGEPLDRGSLHRQLDGETAGGRANMASGLLEAYAQVDAQIGITGGAGHVLVLSDGLLEAGGPSGWRLVELARQMYAQKGIRLSAFGLGSPLQAELLADLAAGGAGGFAFAAAEGEVDQALGASLERWWRIFARGVRLRVQVGEGEVVSIYGAELAAPLPGASEIPLADFAAGEERSLILRLRFPPQSSGEPREVRVLLDFDQVGPSRRTRLERRLSLGRSTGPGTVHEAVEIEERLLIGLDHIRRALESREELPARSAIELLETELPELKARAIARADRALIRLAALFEHFARRLQVLVLKGKLQGASLERDELMRDFLYRRGK
jgi:hypothetical protein